MTSPDRQPRLFSPEAEQSLLGALLLDQSAFGKISRVVAEQDFYRDDHRRIFEQIRKLHDQRKHVDVVSVADAIEQSNLSDQTGGIAYLAEIANSAISAGIEGHARIVRRDSYRRRLEAVGKEIQAAAGAADPVAALAQANQRIAELQGAMQSSEGYGVRLAFADELPGTFDPPDELVEGLLTAGDLSVWYGDSNSGKTFATVDLAAAVARGVPWMNRRTESGLVVYLAAESPASVRVRLQAYQSHHGIVVPNFAIVESPVDLFADDVDADAIIQTVRQIEKNKGSSARLIIGDTLARLAAGANENAGQDMSQVIRRIDRIRMETSAHVLLIHHSGKVAANGARGWSGIRAAVDTEIEVTDGPTGRCIEITKQRDLPTKGERIGFRLDVVKIGRTKWGTPATSCIVMPADAPIKTATGKRISEIGGAIVEFLRNREQGIKKKAMVEHFDGRYTKSAVYRELKRLVEHGQILEVAGVVAVSGEVRKGAD